MLGDWIERLGEDLQELHQPGIQFKFYIQSIFNIQCQQIKPLDGSISLLIQLSK